MDQVIAVLLGIYLLGEAIAAASLMDGGDKLSRVGKYLLVAIIGLWMVFESKQVDIWHITMAAALALFVWPKMLKRIDQIFEHLVED